MKNRVLLAMLIIFIVFAGIGITCGTIFVVKDVEILDVTTTSDVLKDEEKNEIIAKSGLKGKNILFNLNTQAIIQGVKSVDPTLKVQSITAEFPNRVVLKVSRRLPVYYDSKNQLFFDAEMCRVKETNADCIDITRANLSLVSDLDFGDVAVGKDKWAQCKIDQLKTLATCFDSLDGLKIAYANDDDSVTVSNEYVCLLLKVKPTVTFKIKLRPSENFLHALRFTQQIYQKVQIDGVYQTLYRSDAPNKIGIKMYHDENAKNPMKDKDGKEIIYYEE